MRKLFTFQSACWALMFLLLLCSAPGCASQRTFDSPDQAATALVHALRSGDQKELGEILGNSDTKLLSSGDPVADRSNRDTFIAAYDEKHALVPDGTDSVNLVVGPQDWPLPIPIAREKGKEPGRAAWRFDTAAGRDEIINRRIGRNELDAIQTCLAIMDAQREYAVDDPAHDGIPEYAQKFLSDAGRRNGLYWPTAEGEKPSPLGNLAAQATLEGYTAPRTGSGPSPYHGYLYRILTAQGSNAPGGARNYIINNKLIGGYAVVAWPAEYGGSGIMTFLMSYDGIIYQRNLGDDTAKIAAAMKTFDPDSSWTKVDQSAIENP